MELEELQNELLRMRDVNENLERDIAAMRNENEEFKKRIEKLQEHNQELFIRCTSPQKTGDDDQKPKLKTIEQIAKEMRGKK